MKAKRIQSGKTNRIGWRYRFTSPLTKLRTYKTIWMADRRISDKAFQEFLDGLEARRVGLPVCSGWELLYSELVRRFLSDAPISSDTRRKRLKQSLESNPLRIKAGADFTQKATLTSHCLRIRNERGEEFVRKCIQQPLKQLSAWAASIDLFPHDPLRDWKKLPRSNPRPTKRAFMPEELWAILAASDEFDELNGCPFHLSLVFKVLLVTGNRPGAVCLSLVNDFDGSRIALPPGCGKKRNGACTVSPVLAAELKQMLLNRGKPDGAAPLLVSGEGKAIDGRNLRDSFKRAATLAFVKMCWPLNDPRTTRVTPLDVALSIYANRLVGFDGQPPKKTHKIEAREQRRAALKALFEQLKPIVENQIADRPLYALRHTHITWARRFVNFDAVRMQVGHAGRDIEEMHYNDADFVNPSESSQAVCDVLNGKKELRKRVAVASHALQVDYNSDYVGKTDGNGQAKPSVAPSQIIVAEGIKKVRPEGLEPSTR